MILVPDWNDAQDIMQRVSIILWRKSNTFQPGTNLLGWAMVVAKLEVRIIGNVKGEIVGTLATNPSISWPIRRNQ